MLFGSGTVNWVISLAVTTLPRAGGDGKRGQNETNSPWISLSSWVLDCPVPHFRRQRAGQCPPLGSWREYVLWRLPPTMNVRNAAQAGALGVYCGQFENAGQTLSAGRWNTGQQVRDAVTGQPEFMGAN
jgi:hypothetical protein